MWVWLAASNQCANLHCSISKLHINFLMTLAPCFEKISLDSNQRFGTFAPVKTRLKILDNFEWQKLGVQSLTLETLLLLLHYLSRADLAVFNDSFDTLTLSLSLSLSFTKAVSIFFAKHTQTIFLCDCTSQPPLKSCNGGPNVRS